MLFDDIDDAAPDDLLDWFTTSPEYRRDRNLRRAIDELATSRWDIDAQRAALRRELDQVKGTTADQLLALTRRVEAYFELDTLRDSLDPGTKATRLAAAGMVQQLALGQRPEPMETGAGDYALPFAMNAVRGLVLGEPDEDALARAVALDPSSELLVVAAVAGLGRGEAVVDRLSSVLASDGVLAPAQAVVLDGVVAGAFGPDAMAAARPALAPVVASDGWVEWLGEDGIGRLLAAVTGEPVREGPVLVEWTPSAPPDPVEVPSPDPDLSALRATAGELIMAGRLDERPRLAKVEQLSRIAFAIPEPDHGPALGVTDVVRRLLADPATPAPVRSELVAWVEPALRGAAAALRPAPPPPARRDIWADGEAIEVTATSTLPDVRAAAAPEVAARERRAVTFGRAAIGAVVVGVLACVLLWRVAWVAALMLLVAGLVVGWVARTRRADAANEAGFLRGDAERQARELEAAQRTAAATDEDNARLTELDNRRLDRVEEALAKRT